MKTIHSALPVPRLVHRFIRDLPRASFLLLTRLLCVERNGALVCFIPGAPIVRLPVH